MELPYDPSIPFLGIYLKRTEACPHKNSHSNYSQNLASWTTQMSINWLTDEGMNKMGSVLVMGCYSVIKRKAHWYKWLCGWLCKHHAQLEKADTKAHKLYDSFMWNVQNRQIQRQKVDQQLPGSGKETVKWVQSFLSRWWKCSEST